MPNEQRIDLLSKLAFSLWAVELQVMVAEVVVVLARVRKSDVLPDEFNEIKNPIRIRLSLGGETLFQGGPSRNSFRMKKLGRRRPR